MRNFIKHISFVALLAVGLISCKESGNDPDNVYEARELRIVLGGDFINVSEEPIVRSNDTDKKTYIGINVYRKSCENPSNNEYEPYAYGVFNDQSQISLTIQPIYMYKFECTTIKEDHHKIALDSEGLLDPFTVGSESKYPKDKLNEFVFSKDENLSKIGGRPTLISLKEDDNQNTIESKMEDYPSVIRCYCELENYELGLKPEIYLDLKLASFAILIKAEVPDGELTWKGDELNFNDASLKPGETEKMYYFSSDNIKGCFKNPSSIANTVSDKISFIWTRANGEKTGDTGYLSFSPGKIKTLNINLDAGDKDLTFKFPGEQSFEKEEDVDVKVK